jgi:putative ABC transport system permease protein
MLSDLKQDVAYAIRSVRKSPAFTFVTLLTLALGIGANTAIFSVVHSVLLRPLPYRDAERLVFLWSSTASNPRAPLWPGRLVDFRERLTSVENVAGISHLSVNLTGNGDPERISASSVSSGFFDLLGVAPLLGEPFRAGRADARDVVLSHGLWTRRFGSDPSIVGRDITINGRARRVVAVMPPEFGWPAITGRGASTAVPPELWLPGAGHDIPRTPSDDPAQDLSANRRMGYLRAVGRLTAGATVMQAQRESEALVHRLAVEHPREEAGVGSVIQPLREQFFGAVRQPLLILAGAVAFVLAIACANAASLLLGRATARRREIAMRLALGAGRVRIVRQLLTESILLALGGACGGLFVAWSARAWLITLAPSEIPRLSATSIDAPVLVFTLVISVVTGVLFGLVPAWQVSTGALTADLNEGSARGSAGPRTSRTRDVLVGGQIAVALVLLIGAGLLLRSFDRLTRVDVGIDTRNLLTFDMVLSGPRASAQASQAAFYASTLEAIRAVPGVRGVGAAATLPIGGDDFSVPYEVEGKPALSPQQELTAGYQVVTPAYFDAMGIAVVSGRDFRESDTRDAPGVVMVNEALARQQWPGEDPIGRRLRVGRGSAGPWMTVVGLVRDIRHLGPATAPRPELYQPFTQSSFSFMAFVVRTEGNPRAIVPSVRAAVARLDPTQPLSRMTTMEEHVTRSLSRPQFMSTLTAAFAGLALLLSVVGIYGVMAYSVAQRTREIAIRTALGAQQRDVLRLVMRKALWLSLAGVGAGLTAAWGLSRILAGQLFGVTATDPLTYSSVALLLIVVALLAGAVPAVRAMRIDGTEALRA